MKDKLELYLRDLERATEKYYKKSFEGDNDDKNFYRGMAHGTSATRNDISRIFKLPLQVNFNGDNLKSPHQELLDLGWVIDEDDKNETHTFYYKNRNTIRINRINKTCLTAIYIDLQLAKILVRYLEELK